jgi:hypothetical protein
MDSVANPKIHSDFVRNDEKLPFSALNDPPGSARALCIFTRFFFVLGHSTFDRFGCETRETRSEKEHLFCAQDRKQLKSNFSYWRAMTNFDQEGVNYGSGCGVF